MLELRNITKIYKTESEDVHALRGVSINFRPNEFVSILGQSGCGKTTLLNIMGGLDQYTDGDLIINGISTKEYEDADWDAYRNHSIGFVFQNYNLIHHQTVLSNVMLALTLSGVSEEETRKRAIEALEAVGLGDQINKRPAQMSGGQMQRVAIARALINNPDILLADEPTGALDSETSIQIMSILKKVAEDRLVIMVTHNPELAEEYSTRIIKLADGLVKGDSNPYNGDEGVSGIASADASAVKDGIASEVGENGIVGAEDGTADDAKSDAPFSKRRHKSDKHKTERLRSMSMKTALGLSLNNLMTKKARTILTSFAGSIGIIGIALILSVSTGFQDYIDQIENDTLTSYPLTIESETADMSSMLTAFASTSSDDEDSEDKSADIKEEKVMSNMFASVGSNDLTSFKTYLENDDTIGDNFKWVQSSYGVVPQVYSTSFEYGVQQVSPGSLMSSYFNSLQQTAMSYSNMDVFFELVNNESMVEENYKVLKGKWPTKYNEVVLILQDEDTLSDYISYSIGLRNPQDLNDMVNAMLKGEEVNYDTEPLEWSYDDLMGMEFALVPATSEYKYNSGYNVWEDMSSDETYMKEIINNSEKLTITCIACPNPDNTSASVSSGIGYLPELTEHIIDNASETDIVKQQLANKDVDVFSGKTFEELKNNDTEIGFGDLISIDEAKLASALGGDLSEDAIEKLIAENTKNALKDVDPTPIAQDVVEDLSTQLTAVNTSLATNYGDSSGKVTISNTTVVGNTVKDNYSKGQYSAIVNKLLDRYATALTKEFEDNNLSLTTAQIMTVMSDTLKDEDNTTLVSNYATGIAIQETVGNVPTAMANLALKMGSMFNVDPSGIASAFSMSMDEDELTRLISSSMSGSSSTSYAENLRSLGYADYDNPYRMLFYLKDFEAKENFMDFIDEYNEEMTNSDQEDKVINYTDYTGILMKSVKKITNSVSYVLIAFVAISLIVSSIMIGVITYISVLERTKEIGILRAIGASKKDISRIFNAETIIVGFCAGLMGIIVSLLLLIPINAILYKLTAIAALKAKLPVVSAFVLVAISVMLTFIAGLIPSGMAAKKDPVEALRTE